MVAVVDAHLNGSAGIVFRGTAALAAREAFGVRCALQAAFILDADVSFDALRGVAFGLARAGCRHVAAFASRAFGGGLTARCRREGRGDEAEEAEGHGGGAEGLACLRDNGRHKRLHSYRREFWRRAIDSTDALRRQS